MEEIPRPTTPPFGWMVLKPIICRKIMVDFNDRSLKWWSLPDFWLPSTELLPRKLKKKTTILKMYPLLKMVMFQFVIH